MTVKLEADVESLHRFICLCERISEKFSELAELISEHTEKTETSPQAES